MSEGLHALSLMGFQCLKSEGSMPEIGGLTSLSAVEAAMKQVQATFVNLPKGEVR